MRRDVLTWIDCGFFCTFVTEIVVLLPKTAGDVTLRGMIFLDVGPGSTRDGG